jgi:hypothetical protein
MRSRLFRWNTRIDRSLREGREILHQQVRSKEPLVVWIEGADDLTQEAQAFMRRILDTRSQDVHCILEVRDPSKLSAPVLSRCSLQRIGTEISFRKTALLGKATAFKLIGEPEKEFPTTFEGLATYKMKGKDPVLLLNHLIKIRNNDLNGREALRRWASGHSVWLQIAWLLSL